MKAKIENLLLCGLRYSIRRAGKCAEGCQAFQGLLSDLSDEAVAEAVIEAERWKQNAEMITRAGGRSLQDDEDRQAALSLLDAARVENIRRKRRKP